MNTDTVPQLKYRTHHNIGIAMSTSQGLYVPSLKDVASNSILSIASQINVLKQRSLTNTFTIDDLAPGSISFSNIGTVGGMGLHPCLSANEVCIGAVGRVYRVVKSEMVEGKEVFVGRDVLMSSWNADHRVVDGQTMAQFVMTWKTYLEDPLLMMAEME